MDRVIELNYTPNKKQQLFHASTADEVFYGGAKGGGKSCSLVIEAFLYGTEHAGASIYLFRETYDDLEANLIKEWKDKIPREAQAHEFNNGGHYATLTNGSVIKFRYIRNLIDAESYIGRSMDFIGVDELTRHERKAIQVLLSCLRSPKGFPPVFKGTGNPGGIGHTFVKQDFIEATEYGRKIYLDPITGNKRQFIPATVYDNDVLMKNDPAYVRRLENLPENERKAFLHGDWDIFEGQFFAEFRHSIHVTEPFEIPRSWDRYFVLDYGLDMLAGYWIAIDTEKQAYVYRELYQNNLIISDAAQKIVKLGADDRVRLSYGPPDLWNRRQDTGKSAAETFADNGLVLVEASNRRIPGWLGLKEWLKVITVKDEQLGDTYQTSRLKIFRNCKNLIRVLPQLQFDDKDPGDAAKEPHELTHACDAMRYFFGDRPTATHLAIEKNADAEEEDTDYELDTFFN